MPIDQYMIQSSSKKLICAVDGYYQEDPQLNNVQRVRNVGSLSPK